MVSNRGFQMSSVTGASRWGVRRQLAASLLVATVCLPARLPAQEAFISGSGVVRKCDTDGQNIESVGNQYGLDGDQFITRTMEEAHQCLSQPQTFFSLQSADPNGAAGLGYRMVSQNRVTVTAEPQYTEARGTSNMYRPLCFVALSNLGIPPTVDVWVKARGSRSTVPEQCLDELGNDSNAGACASAMGRFGGLGDGRFMDRDGHYNNPSEFLDVTLPASRRWVQLVDMQPGGSIPGLYRLFGALSGTLLTRVAEAPSVSAFGDLRFIVAVDKDVTRLESCRVSDADSATAGDPLPFPSWVIDKGEVAPDDFSLAISPPTSAITLAQSFDLTLMAATGGPGITGVTGTIDGQDVSSALAACLAPAGALRGVAGPILACRGLSGRMLAGFFGTGAHTLAVTLALSDGRTISDSATWTILP